MLDVFDDADGAFSLMRLTAAINKLPEVPSVIGDLGVFEEDGVDVRTVAIEKRDETLALVESSPYGGPGEAVADVNRTLIDVRIPHFQRDDAILAEEIQGIRAFGTENTLETIEDRVNTKMARHTRAFDFTMENLRLGAISGQVLDKDGTTVLFDAFGKFGISAPPEIDFALGTATTDVLGKCQQTLDEIEDALEGFKAPRVFALAGNTFMQELWTHSKVVATYANWQAAVALRNDPRLPFEYGGISWIRYHTKPKAKAARGNTPMIGDTKVRFVASGVPELFITRFSPADYEETVNTIGLPRYAKQFARPDGKGRHLQVQMNAMCLCTMPEALQRGTTSN
jgi:hypothetical protein